MELRELREEFLKAKMEYQIKHRNALIELLKECGLWEVDVIAKGFKGRLFVERVGTKNESEVVFRPYKKDGNISSTVRHVGFIDYINSDKQCIKTQLNNIFRVANKE